MADLTSANVYGILIPALVKLKRGQITADEMIEAAWEAQKDLAFDIDQAADPDELLALKWGSKCEKCGYIVPRDCHHSDMDCQERNEERLEDERYTKEAIWAEIESRKARFEHKVFLPVQFEKLGRLVRDEITKALLSLVLEGKLKAFSSVYDCEGEQVWYGPWNEFQGPVAAEVLNALPSNSISIETHYELPDPA